MTLPEVLLWVAIRRKQVDGFRFRRQHPIGPFILDFYCEQARLAVEIDGDCHEGRQAYDLRRDAWLQARGVRTLRLGARHVLASIDAAVEDIRSALREPR
jgi:very-short-patch-repair endonuclease